MSTTIGISKIASQECFLSTSYYLDPLVCMISQLEWNSVFVSCEISMMNNHYSLENIAGCDLTPTFAVLPYYSCMT